MIALSGTASAAARLTGQDIVDESLTGADMVETSLGTAPNAAALGGRPAGDDVAAGDAAGPGTWTARSLRRSSATTSSRGRHIGNGSLHRPDVVKVIDVREIDLLPIVANSCPAPLIAHDLRVDADDATVDPPPGFWALAGHRLSGG